jgi:hypothetical protein
MEEVHKRGNGVTCKACMATATASLKRKPRLPLKNPGLGGDVVGPAYVDLSGLSVGACDGVMGDPKKRSKNV